MGPKSSHGGGILLYDGEQRSGYSSQRTYRRYFHPQPDLRFDNSTLYNRLVNLGRA